MIAGLFMDHGVQALAAVSAVLVLFTLLMHLSAQPSWRQRCAELGTGLGIVTLIFVGIGDQSPGDATGNLTLMSAKPRESNEAALEGRGLEASTLTFADSASRAPWTAAAIPAAQTTEAERERAPMLRASLAAVSRSIATETQALERAQKLSLLWLFGCAASTLWLAFGCWQLRCVLRSSRLAGRKLLAQWTDKVGGSKRVKLMVHNGRIGPFCTGLLRPAIILPQSLLDSGSDSAVLSVLRHENVHLQRRDLIGHYLFRLARILLWFHPLMWWLESQAREAAELIADDLAATEGANRPEYARSLLELAEAIPSSTRLSVSLPSLLRSQSQLSRRIEMLLSRRTPWRERLGAKASLLLCLCAIGAWSLGTQFAPRLGAQTTSEEESIQELLDRQDELRQRLKTLDRRLRDYSRKGVKATAPRDSRNPFDSSVLPKAKVRAGDSMMSILRRHGYKAKDLSEVKKLNPDLDARALKVGDRLVLPRRGGTYAPSRSSDAFGATSTNRGGPTRVSGARSGVASNRGAVGVGGGRGGVSGEGQNAGPAGPWGFMGSEGRKTDPRAKRSLRTATGLSSSRRGRTERPGGQQPAPRASTGRTSRRRTDYYVSGQQPTATSRSSHEFMESASSLVSSDNALFLMLERVIDSEAEVELLDAQLQRSAALAKRGSVSSAEVRQLEIKRRAANSKLELARSFVKAEKDITTQAIERTRRQLERFTKTSQMYEVIEARLSKLRHHLRLAK